MTAVHDQQGVAHQHVAALSLLLVVVVVVYRVLVV
jgi:hypothetical protein